MATIRINNSSFSGRSITITNNKVMIDGKEIPLEDQKEINISVTGYIDSINADSCNKIEVTGSAQSVKTMSGDVSIGTHVSGSVNTMSGDIKCGNIGGSVSTMSGDIRHS
ncbi:MAG: hypothetical protein V4651_08575 [Bacteroidota bacterium]